MGDSLKGIIAGLFSGIVWAAVGAIGVAVIVSVYHDRLVADIQPRIPPPQPILPGFPQLGYTTPPTADQLIQTAVGMGVSWIFFLGLLVGPVLGLVFSSLEKSFPRTMNVILKSIGDVLIIYRVNIVCKLFCEVQSDFYSTRFIALNEALTNIPTAPRIRCSSSRVALVGCVVTILLSSSSVDCLVR